MTGCEFQSISRTLESLIRVADVFSRRTLLAPGAWWFQLSDFQLSVAAWQGLFGCSAMSLEQSVWWRCLCRVTVNLYRLLQIFFFQWCLPGIIFWLFYIFLYFIRLREGVSIVKWRLNHYSLWQNYWYWTGYIEVIWKCIRRSGFDRQCTCTSVSTCWASNKVDAISENTVRLNYIIQKRYFRRLQCEFDVFDILKLREVTVTSEYRYQCWPKHCTEWALEYIRHLFTNDKGRLAPLTCHIVHQTLISLDNSINTKARKYDIKIARLCHVDSDGLSYTCMSSRES